MTLTTMDTKPALVVIDLQKGIVGIPAAHPISEIVPRAASLAAAFRRHGLPVVLVTVTGGAPGRTEAPRRSVTPSPDWADLVDELILFHAAKTIGPDGIDAFDPASLALLTQRLKKVESEAVGADRCDMFLRT